MRRSLFLSAALLFAPMTAHAGPTVSNVPSPISDFDVNGVPCVGCKIFVYSAGTTTKITTYTDSTGGTAQTNPIITNARGEPQNVSGSSVGMWIQPGVSYKMVLAPSTDTDPPTSPIWTVDNLVAAPGGSGSGGLTTASNNAALNNLPSTVGQVLRLGFSTAGDSPPLSYTGSGTACSLNSGVGDGGSQTATSDSGCWNAVLTNGVTQGGLRFEWWGVSQGTENSISEIILYVNSVGGVDTSNYCIISTLPCATFTRAATEAQLFDVEGGNIRIKDLDSGTHTFVGSILVSGPLRGSANTVAYPSNGEFNPSKVIFDGQSKATIQGSTSGAGLCYALGANNGALVALENITIQADTSACTNGQDPILVQQNGGVDFYGGVTLGQMGSNSAEVHVESSAYGLQIWAPWTVTGSGASMFAIGPYSLVLVNSGSATITPTPSYSSGMLFIGAGGLFQTNVACPFGAPAWNSGTTYGINGIVVGSDTFCYATVAGGNLNHNPVGDAGVHWTKLTASTTPIPTGNAYTGAPFEILPGGQIESQLNPISWGGNSIALMMGGAYRGDGFVVGTLPSVTGSTGLGTGTASITGGSYNSVITLSPTGSPGPNGNVSISFPFQVTYSGSGNKGHCTVTPANDGTGTWTAPATTVGAQANGLGNFLWTNGGSTNLTAGQTYPLNVVCGAGS